MATLTNRKSGETIETTMTDSQAATLFAEKMGGKDNWLWFWIHKAVAEMTCEVVKAGSIGQAAISFLAASFVVALGYGLKRPMIRVHFRNARFKLYLSNRGTLCLKSGELVPGTNDPIGDEEYIGCWQPSGEFLPAKLGYGPGSNRRFRQLEETEKAFLENLGANPVAFLAQCSKDMCRCCYCYKPLEDARSKAVGYGQTCAKHWGLPWGDYKEGEKVPSFAKSYDETAAAIVEAIRQNPQDLFNWECLAEFLENAGLPRCKMPASSVIMPRA